MGVIFECAVVLVGMKAVEVLGELVALVCGAGAIEGEAATVLHPGGLNQ